MKFKEIGMQGPMLIEPEVKCDNRGNFFRAYCEKEFLNNGIDCNFVQDSISVNLKKNTIRGLHMQLPPYQEDKLVRCIRGAILDVIVDMRVDSKTYLNYYKIKLTQENNFSLYIPKGFAHGFQTLENNSLVYYKMSQEFIPSAYTGFYYLDPKIGIAWETMPDEVTISNQDKEWELL